MSVFPPWGEGGTEQASQRFIIGAYCLARGSWFVFIIIVLFSCFCSFLVVDLLIATPVPTFQINRKPLININIKTNSLLKEASSFLRSQDISVS